jgi:hypothetical protein
MIDEQDLDGQGSGLKQEYGFSVLQPDFFNREPDRLESLKKSVGAFRDGFARVRKIASGWVEGIESDINDWNVVKDGLNDGTISLAGYYSEVGDDELLNYGIFVKESEGNPDRRGTMMVRIPMDFVDQASKVDDKEWVEMVKKMSQMINRFGDKLVKNVGADGKQDSLPQGVYEPDLVESLQPTTNAVTIITREKKK